MNNQHFLIVLLTCFVLACTALPSVHHAQDDGMPGNYTHNCTNSSGYFADPCDCNAFWQCSNWIATLKHCEKGLVFWPNKTTCVWPVNYTCHANTTGPCSSSLDLTINVEEKLEAIASPIQVEAEEVVGNYTHKCTNSSGYFADPCDCNAFWQCSNWIATLKHCEKGLVFWPNKTTCVWPVNYTCHANTTGPCSSSLDLTINVEEELELFASPVQIEAEEVVGNYTHKCTNSSGLFPDPCDCNAFWQCSNWVPFLQKCKKGLVFSPKVGNCVWPVNYTCHDNTTGPCSSTKAVEIASLIEVEPEEVVSPDAAPSTPAPCVHKCTTRFGLFPDPRDCSSFFQCNEFHAFLHHCPPHLEFNAATKQCDYPENAHCKADPNAPCAAPDASEA